MKICRECHKNKDSVYFGKDRKAPDGLAYWCRDCVNEYVKEYRIKNKDRVYKNRRDWVSKNKDKAIETSRRYEQKHKEKRSSRDRREYQRDYGKRNRKEITQKQAIRIKENPELKIVKNLRSRLLRAIKGEYKTGSAVKDLECSIKELKAKLENMFYCNPMTKMPMTWENYGKGHGKWQIDHIKPLHWFNLLDREEFLKANSHKNLQPLWHEDHIKKSKSDLKRIKNK